MWAEGHILTGIALQKAAEGHWEIALPLAIMSHWALDDLNVDNIARIYHGYGEHKWDKALTSLFRVPLWLGILYLFYQDPMFLICGLSAWLCLDHEWFLRIFGKAGYGLHARMFPKWLHTELGLIPLFIAMGLLLGVGLW